MEAYRSARQFGISIILFTLLFRLFETGIPQGLLQKLRPPNTPTIRIETETGQAVRSLSVETFFPFPYIAESSPPMDYVPPDLRPEFTEADAQAIKIVNFGKEAPDLGALIAAPLTFRLDQDAPTVLILHTHTTESYTMDGENYRESSPYRTLDEGYNMLSIGDRVAELLEEGGIHVIHDRQLHDYPSYNTAYTHARKTTAANLEDNPEIQLVLDIHRDASDSGSGQLRTHATICGEPGAQLMLVMGCGNAGLKHPNWEQNLALALKLQATLEAQCPGICRPVSIRTQRFNQDLSPGTLLVEVGAAGNTHSEAILAAEQLAKAILTLKHGTAG